MQHSATGTTHRIMTSHQTGSRSANPLSARKTIDRTKSSSGRMKLQSARCGKNGASTRGTTTTTREQSVFAKVGHPDTIGKATVTNRGSGGRTGDQTVVCEVRGDVLAGSRTIQRVADPWRTASDDLRHRSHRTITQPSVLPGLLPLLLKSLRPLPLASPRLPSLRPLLPAE